LQANVLVTNGLFWLTLAPIYVRVSGQGLISSCACALAKVMFTGLQRSAKLLIIAVIT